jgi:hypothetical protein
MCLSLLVWVLRAISAAGTKLALGCPTFDEGAETHFHSQQMQHF